jgi:hypothetical protein
MTAAAMELEYGKSILGNPAMLHTGASPMPGPAGELVVNFIVILLFRQQLHQEHSLFRQVGKL